MIEKVVRKLVSELAVGPNWRLFDLERRMRPRKDLYWERRTEVGNYESKKHAGKE